MTDHSNKRLGRLPARHDSRVPRLASFLTRTVDPESVLWGRDIAHWGDMKNDVLGCCTAAAKGHFLMAVTDEVRTLWTPTDSQVVGFYERSTGYRMGQPMTDNGGVMVDVLHCMLAQGFAGRRIAAFGSVRPQDKATVRHVIAALCGMDVGVDLPVSAQTQDTWGEGGEGGDEDKGGWGGHCVYANGYDADYVHFISWGRQMKMTWDFWDRYVDEGYGILAGAWIKEGVSPAGVDVATLTQYTERLRT